jgi:outer membrane protein OmpA-like peptidoglycan-associated protein
MKRLVLAFLCAVVLAGCATGPSRRAEPPPAPAAPAGPEVVPMLVQEQRWLDQWFRGTPVVIAPAEDGALEVEVPLQFSFDAGRAAVKPPLAAVLDKVSESLHRQATARIQVATPADPSGSGRIASERGSSVRDYLVAKGVQRHRIRKLDESTDKVALRLLPPPTMIEKLEDEPPAAGRRVTPRAGR